MMLGPLELQLFPSCFNCISWSADGEIAVAAGEYVQILVSASNPTLLVNEAKHRKDQ